MKKIKMINYLFESLFALNVLNLEMWGICFLASFGEEKRTPSFIAITFSLFTADFLSLAKNVPINIQEKSPLNNFPLSIK